MPIPLCRLSPGLPLRFQSVGPSKIVGGVLTLLGWDMHSAGADKVVPLSPPIILGLDDALEYIEEDELVEVRPLCGCAALQFAFEVWLFAQFIGHRFSLRRCIQTSLGSESVLVDSHIAGIWFFCSFILGDNAH
jgi:hypothetical protein